MVLNPSETCFSDGSLFLCVQPSWYIFITPPAYLHFNTNQLIYINFLIFFS